MLYAGLVQSSKSKRCKPSINLSRVLFLPSFSSLQYYILLTNFVFMGIVPSGIMIVFNVLVVRAVNEANKRRAR